MFSPINEKDNKIWTPKDSKKHDVTWKLDHESIKNKCIWAIVHIASKNIAISLVYYHVVNKKHLSSPDDKKVFGKNNKKFKKKK